MGTDAVSRRRNLRPRKPFSAEDVGAAPRRNLRSSRAKLSAEDFLVFDNEEEDADYDGNAAPDEEEEAEPDEDQVSSSRSRATRGSSRRERREPRSARITRSSGATRSSRSARRARSLRRRRSRSGVDDEDSEVAEEKIEEESDDESSLDEDEDDEEINEEDENSLDSDGLSSSHRRSSAKKRSKSQRKPPVLLPEDVEGRDPHPDQPEADPEDVRYSPSVAFLAIFVATFIDIFPEISVLPAPQDIEEGLVSEEPSELVELLFRKLLGFVLNRKKDIEPGRYSSALSELHSQRHALGMGSYFPQLNWKSRSNAFAELTWVDRAELLHVLIHWSLAASDKVRAILKTLNEDAMTPWMGADDKGCHYYIVGFDPLAEGSTEHTRFRIYRETNRLLNTVKWEPVASNVTEVIQFLQSHQIPPAKTEAAEETVKEEKQAKQGQASTTEDGEASANILEESEVQHGPDSESAEVLAEPSEPPKYNLPDTVVEILQSFLPAMQLSEQVAAERIERENKRARRRRDIQYHTEAIARGEGRFSGRLRRRRTNYSDFLRDAYEGLSENEDDSDDMSSRSRRRRARTDYAWQEPEPETREQRHARLLAERADRDAQSRDRSMDVEEPEETPGPEENSEGLSAMDVDDEPRTHIVSLKTPSLAHFTGSTSEQVAPTQVSFPRPSTHTEPSAGTTAQPATEPATAPVPAPIPVAESTPVPAEVPGPTTVPSPTTAPTSTLQEALVAQGPNPINESSASSVHSQHFPSSVPPLGPVPSPVPRTIATSLSETRPDPAAVPSSIDHANNASELQAEANLYGSGINQNPALGPLQPKKLPVPQEALVLQERSAQTASPSLSAQNSSTNAAPPLASSEQVQSNQAPSAPPASNPSISSPAPSYQVHSDQEADRPEPQAQVPPSN